MRRGWRRREGEGGSEFVMSGAEAADDVNFTLSVEHVRFFVHTLADIVHFVYTYAYTNSNIYIYVYVRVYLALALVRYARVIMTWTCH